MKIITVIAQQVSPEALKAALPIDGIHAVTIDETQSFTRTAATIESYRGRKVAKHVTTVYRVQVVAEDDAVQRIIDGIAFAHGAGLLGDARAWVSAEAADLFATPGALAASA
jgi:nitrogen regulatory protein P-II 1